MRVYCKDCKYYKYESGEYGGHTWCRAAKIRVDHPTFWYMRDGSCDEINKYNSCNKYEPKPPPKWWEFWRS